MPWYTCEQDHWSKASGPADEDLSIQIEARSENERPHIRLLNNGAEALHLSGVDPRPHTDTTHTIAWMTPDGSSTLLFAVHAQKNDLIFEDLRSQGEGNETDHALEQARSSLNEILIPVYIDDVISDISEALSGLVILHTAQYESSSASNWTYFRGAGFDDGDLVLEVERGEL